MPGLDLGYLGLVPGVKIPHEFKIPSFSKYDGVSFPKLHLRSYVRKNQLHTTDKKLWVHLFQEILSRTQLEWFLPVRGFQHSYLEGLGHCLLPSISIQCRSSTDYSAVTRNEHGFQWRLQRIGAEMERPGW